LQFDLRSAQGKLIASLMAALAEFERDLLRERVRSGIAAARKRGVVFGRRPGQRVKSDRFAPKVLKLGKDYVIEIDVQPSPVDLAQFHPRLALVKPFK
jgi:DNA invertase Pin-like site-specific DNA recombinase